MQKELDSARPWHIIRFTAGIRDRGDPASAQRPTETTQARSPETVRHVESASGRRHRSAISNRDFFDPAGLVQVKYEMLRRVRVDKQSVSQSASAFGFSRPTYYQAEDDFQREGLAGLLPEKRGPRQSHKLTSDVLGFAARLRSSDPSIRPAELAAAVQKQFGITAHPRSIERALARQEKKRR